VTLFLKDYFKVSSTGKMRIYMLLAKKRIALLMEKGKILSKMYKAKKKLHLEKRD
jgi:hypothetical protein